MCLAGSLDVPFLSQLGLAYTSYNSDYKQEEFSVTQHCLGTFSDLCDNFCSQYNVEYV